MFTKRERPAGAHGRDGGAGHPRELHHSIQRHAVDAAAGLHHRDARKHDRKGQPEQKGGADPFGAGDLHPAAKALYFAVGDLDAVHARAAALSGLTAGDIHGEPAGEIAVRPWGERSFYCADPWGNPLCFVEAGTVYGG